MTNPEYDRIRADIKSRENGAVPATLEETKDELTLLLGYRKIIFQLNIQDEILMQEGKIGIKEVHRRFKERNQYNEILQILIDTYQLEIQTEEKLLTKKHNKEIKRLIFLVFVAIFIATIIFTWLGS